MSTSQMALVLIALILFSVVSTGYIHLFHEQLEIREWLPTTSDTIISILMVVAVVAAVKMHFGLLLPGIFGVFFLYAAIGHYLPGFLQSVEIRPIGRLFHIMSTGLSGIYGTMLDVSANYLILFFLFASLLLWSGAVEFMREVAKIVGSKIRSGAAQGAIITSGLVGMVTGSAAPNVAITGSFTLGLMKKAGYTPEQAGAIEATASTGGQIMPPVLGAAAFVMAAFLGVSYWTICMACLIPALLYFFNAGLYAHFQAMKLDIKKTTEKVDYKNMLVNMPLFVIPLSLIVYLLATNHSPGYSIFWTIVVLMGLSMIKKENRELSRQNLSRLLQSIKSGMMLGAQVAGAIAILGIVVSIITTTGLGIKAPMAIANVSGGNLYIALPLIAGVSFILGCGLLSVAVYVLVAVLCAPILVELGLLPLQAHLFVYFYAILAQISPPVATAVLIAAPMAGGNYLSTGIQALKAGAGLFILPMFFIWIPEIIGIYDVATDLLPRVVFCVLFFIAFQALFNGFYLKRLKFIESLLLGAVLILIPMYFIMGNVLFAVIGACILIAVTIIQLLFREASAVIELSRK